MAQTNKDKTKQSETLEKVFRYLGKYRIYLLFTILLAAVTVALTLYVPKLTGAAVDDIVAPGKVNFPGVFQILIRIGVCIAITAFAQWLMNICNNKMTYQIVQDVRNEAFQKIEILPLKYIDGHSYGEIVSRVIADVDQFADVIYRCGYNYRNTWIYAFRECEDHSGGCADHPGVLLCSGIYRKENLCYVQTSVRDQSRADRAD